MYNCKTFTRKSVLFLSLTVLLLCSSGALAQMSGETSEFQGKIRLALPKIIYAATGIETNVYFDSVVLVLNSANYAFDVTCSKGIQQAQRWTYKADVKEAGDYPFMLEVRDETNVVIARAKSLIRVVGSESAGDANITCLMVGDSITQNGIYSQRVLDLFNTSDKEHLILIGSRGPGGEDRKNPNRFEGYGGWDAACFATRYTGIAHFGPKDKCGSPFIYKTGEGKPQLDFAKYCSKFNNGTAPDYVTIFLGCNDTFHHNDNDIESTIDTMFKHYDTLLAMFRNFSKDTVIGVILPIPPAASQDAFGANYKNDQTRWQYKRNQHRLVERMIEKYGNSQDKKILLVPAYVNIDPDNGFPRDPATGRMNNGVHPAQLGYYQIGDSIYSWLKSQKASGK